MRTKIAGLSTGTWESSGQTLMQDSGTLGGSPKYSEIPQNSRTPRRRGGQPKPQAGLHKVSVGPQEGSLIEALYIQPRPVSHLGY